VHHPARVGRAADHQFHRAGAKSLLGQMALRHFRVAGDRVQPHPTLMLRHVQ